MAKQQNEFFRQLYYAKWDNGHMFDAGVWSKAFGKSRSSTLPVTSTTRYRTVVSDCGLSVVMELRPSNPRGERRHRVFIRCYKCGKDVQAGRIAQHRC